MMKTWGKFYYLRKENNEEHALRGKEKWTDSQAIQSKVYQAT